MRINPSLACADLLNLKKDIDKLVSIGVNIFHIDIMDGHYVPNLCLSLDHITALRSCCSTEIDVHLMVTNPADYLVRLSALHVDCISFHPDSVTHPEEMIRKIQSMGIKAGIALNPDQEIDDFGELYDTIDYVQLMAVKPGFSGQKFLESTYLKISRLDETRKMRKRSFTIQIDGGIDLNAIPRCQRLGADSIIAGLLCLFNQGRILEDSFAMIKASLN
jgi:ribulose-phosphate 3-epimerase